MRIGATGTSGFQYDLAGAAASLDVLVGQARVGEGVRRVDVRTHPTGPDALEHFLHPAAQPVDLVPHVPEVDPEGALVGVHERHRVEQRHQRRGPGQLELAARALVAGGGGDAVHPEPAGGAQHAAGPAEALSAERVDHQLYAPVVGEGADLAGPVTGAVVDGVVQAPSREEVVLSRAGRADGARPYVAGDVESSQTDPGPSVLDEHGVALA